MEQSGEHSATVTIDLHRFRIELEPDEEGWRAFCPPLERIGASTWGESPREAMRNIEEVLGMIVEEFEEEGRPFLWA